MAKKRKKLKKVKQFTQAFNNAPPGSSFASLGNLLPKKKRDQFLLGLVLGAGVTWLLSNEEVRGRLMRAGTQFYSGLLGGFEEIKEQFADIQAEMSAGLDAE
jgi:hypothetical protein